MVVVALVVVGAEEVAGVCVVVGEGIVIVRVGVIVVAVDVVCIVDEFDIAVASLVVLMASVSQDVVVGAQVH